jgi:small subunit ribosomal protein S21
MTPGRTAGDSLPASVDSAPSFCYLPALNSKGHTFGRSIIDARRLFKPAQGGRLAFKGEVPLVQIFVRDNNVDQALKALKKKMQREGSFREMKRHVHYEKPSEKRARQKAEAVRRARKLARKRAQREGLIAAPKKPAR